MATLVVLIPLLLLAGSAAMGFMALASTRGHRFSDDRAGLMACVGPAAAFLLTMILVLFSGQEGVLVEGYSWLQLGESWVPLSFQVDRITMVMLMVVTGIGTLIHIYSRGYMKGEEGVLRYFCYLNLFMFFMLLLVLGENLLVLFIGWEGVGLCSYLLIGFWWSDVDKANAGMKAFIVNRIGDAGFILGMLTIYSVTGTLSISGIREFVAENPEAFLSGSGLFGVSLATASCLLLFLGATGKSAQIPLFVWLPDAMAGPTPVSALIHAATMVTAGVYMIARMSFLFALSPTSMIVVSSIGALTAAFAGTVAMTQNDIKKVLAYSTVSQLGYMFVAVGLGAVPVALFHVVTHAFFKACLFLGSGSVIHSMGGEQDMRKMGGLARKMPITCATMTLSAVAMAGIPPLSGFFSKDEILWTAFSSRLGHGWLLWALGVFAALCTAIYMGRLIIMTFWGRCRADEETKSHLHESPPSMTFPLIVLALGAAVIGFFGVPHFLGGHNLFAQFITPALHLPADFEAVHGSVPVELSLAVLSVMVAVSGLFMAYRCYSKSPELPEQYVKRNPELYELVRDKYRVDEFYDRAFRNPLLKFADGTFFKLVDRSIVDATVNRVAAICRWLGGRLAATQVGSVRTYIVVMIAGLMAVILSLFS